MCLLSTKGSCPALTKSGQVHHRRQALQLCTIRQCTGPTRVDVCGEGFIFETTWQKGAQPLTAASTRPAKRLAAACTSRSSAAQELNTQLRSVLGSTQGSTQPRLGWAKVQCITAAPVTYLCLHSSTLGQLPLAATTSASCALHVLQLHAAPGRLAHTVLL